MTVLDNSAFCPASSVTRKLFVAADSVSHAAPALDFSAASELDLVVSSIGVPLEASAVESSWVTIQRLNTLRLASPGDSPLTAGALWPALARSLEIASKSFTDRVFPSTLAACVFFEKVLHPLATV